MKTIIANGIMQFKMVPFHSFFFSSSVRQVVSCDFLSHRAFCGTTTSFRAIKELESLNSGTSFSSRKDTPSHQLGESAQTLSMTNRLSFCGSTLPRRRFSFYGFPSLSESESRHFPEHPKLPFLTSHL